MEAVQNQLFIDGEFVDSESRARIPVLNPHDNSLITEVAEAQKADIDRAVEAARVLTDARRALYLILAGQPTQADTPPEGDDSTT